MPILASETIAAVATAMTASGIGIIRMSGPKSREIAGKIYRSKNGKNKKRNRIENSFRSLAFQKITNQKTNHVCRKKSQ